MRNSTLSSTALLLQAELSRAGTASWLSSAQVTPCAAPASAKSSRLGCSVLCRAGAQLHGHCAFLPAGTGTGSTGSLAGTLQRPGEKRGGEEPGSLGVGHNLSQHPFEIPHSHCPFFLLVSGGGQEKLLDHLVISSCRHAPDDCSLIIGSGLGPPPEAKDSGLVSNHFSSPQLRNAEPLQLEQTALACSDCWTSSLEMTVPWFLRKCHLLGYFR